MKKLVSLALVIVSLTACLFMTSCGRKDSDKLYSLKIGDTEIACHVDMDKVLDVFSDLEYEYFESISCAYNGLDKIYDYVDAGFCISTYPVEDKDFVLEITVTSEEIRQMDGKVYVGMSKDDVIALFGSEYTQEGDSMTYTVKDEQTMYFLLYGDTVIEYGISVAQ